MQTPFERAKETLSLANEQLIVCRNYYVLGADDRQALRRMIDASLDVEQQLQCLMLRVEDQ